MKKKNGRDIEAIFKLRFFLEVLLYLWDEMWLVFSFKHVGASKKCGFSWWLISAMGILTVRIDWVYRLGVAKKFIWQAIFISLCHNRCLRRKQLYDIVVHYFWRI